MLANAVFKTNIAFLSLKRMASPPAFQPQGLPWGFPRLRGGGTHQSDQTPRRQPNKGAGRRLAEGVVPGRCSRALLSASLECHQTGVTSDRPHSAQPHPHPPSSHNALPSLASTRSGCALLQVQDIRAHHPDRSGGEIRLPVSDQDVATSREMLRSSGTKSTGGEGGEFPIPTTEACTVGPS